MNEGFWDKLKKPFFVLAPMADVTDPAFRMIIAKYSKYGGADIFDKDGKFTRTSAKQTGGPDVMWTEFVSADGLCSEVGRKVLIKDLKYTEAERPIVAQLFTAHPEKMREASKLVALLGFDGLDINMGCPDRSVEKQGAGAALIKNPRLAREVIRAAKDGIKDAGSKIPVSVKTRIGYNKNELNTWLPEILAEGVAAVTIHARTRKEMSLVPARWEHIREAVEIRNRLSPETLIIGNGDVLDMSDAKKKAKESGADGIMFGRAIFGNPWLFSESQREVGISQRLRVMVEHTKLFEKVCEHPDRTGKNFSVMKKHFKAYVNGFAEAKELRIKLMETEDAGDVEKVINDYLGTHS